MLDGKRKLSLNFGTGLGDQSAASENAIIVGDKVNKLGHVKIEYHLTLFSWLIYYYLPFHSIL